MTDFSGSRFPFASCGDDVTIYELVRILGAENIHVGNHVMIDDFVMIDGRAGMTIGDYTHISAFSSITGQGVTEMGDFANIASGCRLITGSDSLDGSALVGAPIPDEYRIVRRGKIVLGRHSVLAMNVVVLPDVELGEGTVVASGSVVTKSLPPWTTCMGIPAKPVRERPRETVLRLEAELRDRTA
jgi:acetyltransferase-like isoleucine patch superfamily enzyme